MIIASGSVTRARKWKMQRAVVSCLFLFTFISASSNNNSNNFNNNSQLQSLIYKNAYPPVRLQKDIPASFKNVSSSTSLIPKEQSSTYSLSNATVIKYFIDNHLIPLSSCTHYGLHQNSYKSISFPYAYSPIPSYTEIYGYCTSTQNCLKNAAKNLGNFFNEQEEVIEIFIEEASKFLRPTCLFLSEEGVLENGVCCRNILSDKKNFTKLSKNVKHSETNVRDFSKNYEIKNLDDSLGLEEDILGNNDRFKNVEDIEIFKKYEFSNPDELDSQNSNNNDGIYRSVGRRKPNLMDRGHIYSRPSPSSISKNIKGTKKSEYFWPVRKLIFEPIKNPLNQNSLQTSVPKKWWITTEKPVKTISTKPPWWSNTKKFQSSTIKPTKWWQKSTSKPAKPTKWWQTPIISTTKSWQKPVTSKPTGWWSHKVSKNPTTTYRPTITKRWWETTTKKWNRWSHKTSTTTEFPLRQNIKNKEYCKKNPYRSSLDDFDDFNGMTSQRITGGIPLVPHSFPWMAVIVKGRKHVCGGSLIDDRHILTAAHCIATLSSWQVSQLRVVLGVHDRKSYDEPSQRSYKIQTVSRHKDYNRHYLINDIAVLTLTESAEFSDKIWPICLYSGKSKFVNDYATVAGWGSLYDGGYQVHTPRVVEVRIWDNDECRRTYGTSAPGGIRDHFLCAGKKGKDACSGDSGGAFVKKISGIWQQIGVVSWGIGCGKGHYPGIYSRISYFYPWIKKVVQNY